MPASWRGNPSQAPQKKNALHIKDVQGIADEMMYSD
jgi:hypothetical protein